MWWWTIIGSSFGIQELVIINNRIAKMANGTVAWVVSDTILDSLIFQPIRGCGRRGYCYWKMSNG